MRLDRFKLLGLGLLAGSAVAACQEHNSQLLVIPKIAQADTHRGALLIQSYGCGSCHQVPGVDGATGVVGPPLTQFARRVYVAGMVRNTPDNLMDWLKDPQAIAPGNVMPNLGVNERDARDMAAYLYTVE
jgi:cytochrome c2